MSEVKEKDILKVISNALGLKNKKITVHTTFNDIKEWDSLGHLGILTALDKLFEGKIAEITELATADSVKKILQILKKNSLI